MNSKSISSLILNTATAASALLLLAPNGVRAAGDSAGDSNKASTLRVCASRNAPPFSTEDGSGFEDKIAQALAQAMGYELQTVRIDKPPIYLVRDALDQHLCDVVIGLDTGDPRVLTSKPYYRTGYVFVTRQDKNLDVKSWSDERLRSLEHIAVPFDSPGEVMLKQIGKYDDNISYNYSLVNFKSRRNQYVQVEPARLVTEVAGAKADISVAFAPEVARYVRESSVPLRMTLVADDSKRNDGAKVEEDFNQSVGVRKDDRLLLAKVDAGLIKAAPKIRAILEKEGIPLLPVDTSAPALQPPPGASPVPQSGS
jgi:mxaJ protein